MVPKRTQMHHIINLPPLQETNWHSFLLLSWFCENPQTLIAPAQLKEESNSASVLSWLALHYYQAGGLDSWVPGVGDNTSPCDGRPTWLSKEGKENREKVYCSGWKFNCSTIFQFHWEMSMFFPTVWQWQIWPGVSTQSGFSQLGCVCVIKLNKEPVQSATPLCFCRPDTLPHMTVL